jgi:hypothetical protein
MQNATLSMANTGRGGGAANPNSPDAVGMDENEMVEQRLLE